jgi:CPA2 family monovalent cation:H+ antiporter-2
MTEWAFLFNLLVLLAAATAFGAICERLRQSAIVGYLLAGALLGPNALHWVSTNAEVDLLAELGVALLLFTIGLEFSWRQLRRFGLTALGGGSAQVLLTLLLAAVGAALLGASTSTAIALGAMVALSSTASVMRLLLNRAEIDSVHGRGALGILLVQDVAVVPLVLLVDLLAMGGTPGEVAWRAAKTIIAAAILAAAFVLVFNHVMPWLLGRHNVRRNRELPVLIAIVAALGSTIGAHDAGLSPALGAFLAGMLLASSPFAAQIRSDVTPIRTLLVTLFFGAIGMFADPAWMLANWWSVLGVAAAIVVGKALIIWPIMHQFRFTHAHALATGICLAQVGEFSFVLAKAARGSVLSEDAFSLIISATIVTLILTPYLVAGAPRLGALIQRWIARSTTSVSEPDAEEPAERSGVLIVGFGPAGQAVAESLRHRELPVDVVDLNPRVVESADAFGCTGHIGDAAQPEVLEHAGLHHVQAVVITLPLAGTATSVIEIVRSLEPDVRILVRARYHVARWRLRFAGADVVVDEEEQVGRRLAAELNRQIRLPATDGTEAPTDRDEARQDEPARAD